ncbi:hypothetical protein BO82DRAFT_211649 [Aspergillus uvarum CBS 121591]|uniref:Uncharacterized protein n=1 Tax=Aspergillus uvarum CBS 121591 TaxID=1448315 RepID=A0A319DA38_9EURO|nr:hypothetical protein BO82DRAFT_211649 [Aspergillus uvarum CBS 121591]PYH84858.1 hypothetical protein BO82DRAFT_211649 [Aspergillus uvarum CBS 121591]
MQYQPIFSRTGATAALSTKYPTAWSFILNLLPMLSTSHTQFHSFFVLLMIFWSLYVNLSCQATSITCDACQGSSTFVSCLLLYYDGSALL